MAVRNGRFKVMIAKQHQRIRQLESALSCLLDEYVQYVDNACHCDDDSNNEQCSYCYAKDILKNK